MGTPARFTQDPGEPALHTKQKGNKTMKNNILTQIKTNAKTPTTRKE